jgi:serine/threonine protein phosphatase PrpC
MKMRKKVMTMSGKPESKIGKTLMQVIGASVTGASHKLSGKPCQDSIKVNRTYKDSIALLAAADGHGSDKSPFSADGSKIAVDVFHTIMTRYYKKEREDLDRFSTFLHREGDTVVAKEIVREWRLRVKKLHKDRNSGNGEGDNVYLLYGSTLLGLLITPTFYFAFCLGDGDILLLTADSAQHIVENTQQLGVQTYSLCQESAWRKAVTAVRRRPDEAHAFMLATDGFSNSYPDEQLFLSACGEYYTAVNRCGANSVWGSLNNWLSETSEKGSGDDISVLIACDNDL